MSDVMLHGVLKMPPNLWSDSPIDIAQRHGRYVEASKRIEELEHQLAEAQEDAANQRRLADLALAHRDEIIKERDILELELNEVHNKISNLMQNQTVAMLELQEKWHDALRKLEKLQKERDTLVRAFNSRGY